MSTHCLDATTGENAQQPAPAKPVLANAGSVGFNVRTCNGFQRRQQWGTTHG